MSASNPKSSAKAVMIVSNFGPFKCYITGRLAAIVVGTGLFGDAKYEADYNVRQTSENVPS
ncbi:unnamed protein product [Protopolystoma xenopodis]|uniref:Uncharacterized protein n=1 Tax=Protopolystoma xenopodis TaxID=117903 RepID=A0A3S5CLX8_9PLAT|nr:unnamed protein product [Protopolystoma xenopodis]